MNKEKKVTIRRISPRSFGGALMVLALTGETYLMSLHGDVASGHSLGTCQTSADSELSVPAEPRREAVFDNPEPSLSKSAAAASAEQISVGALKSNVSPQTALPPLEPAPAESAAVSRRDDRAAVLRAVASLELQSILAGDPYRTCTINNVKCGEGQQIDGFMVEAIAPGSVTVRAGIYRFELSVRP